jgi:hypothetical protein
MSIRPIDTGKNIELMDRLDKEIKAIRGSKEFDKPLTEPSCKHDFPPGLVRRTFIYRNGRRCTVKCHAKLMVALMRAMKEAPTIEVTASSDSMYSGSYRSWSQQNTLYQLYIQGKGYKAADPCYGYHRRGRALDILNASAKEAKALAQVRVSGLQLYNGSSFGDPPHWSLGEKG